MEKIVLKGLAIPAVFFALWLGLREINWMELFHLKPLLEKTDEQWEKMFDLWVEQNGDAYQSPLITEPIDSLFDIVCKANLIDQDKIQLHVVRNEEVNAFALPGGHIVVHSGLLLDCKNEYELLGVLSHELAHLELNHTRNKLIKEFGLSALISMASGPGNAEVIHEVIKHLSSVAYDRTLEKEADLKAVEYLQKANIHPRYLADFLARLSLDNPEIMSNLTWLSTHPDSKDRSMYVLEQNGSFKPTDEVLDSLFWQNYQQKIELGL